MACSNNPKLLFHSSRRMDGRMIEWIRGSNEAQGGRIFILPKTHGSPVKIGRRGPKRKPDHLPISSIFGGELAASLGDSYLIKSKEAGCRSKLKLFLCELAARIPKNQQGQRDMSPKQLQPFFFSVDRNHLQHPENNFYKWLVSTHLKEPPS